MIDVDIRYVCINLNCENEVNKLLSFTDTEFVESLEVTYAAMTDVVSNWIRWIRSRLIR